MTMCLTLRCIVFQLNNDCMYRAPLKRLIMSSLIQRITSLVESTFSESVDDALFPEHYLQLLHLIGLIRDTDLNIFNPNDIMNDYIQTTRRNFTSVLGFVFAQNEVVTMSVFILRRGFKIPVHDHPNIHVILKMISGTAEVTSYNLADEYQNDLEIRANARVLRRQKTITQVDLFRSDYVASYDVPVVLAPTEGNFYGIRAVGGDAAFFEILTSYTRVQCPWKFYNVTETISLNNQQKVWLTELPYSPANYWGRL